MNTLYQYLCDNYKKNEPIFLSDIFKEEISSENIGQQLRKLVNYEKIKRFDRGIYYLPNKTIFKSQLKPEKVIEYKYLKDKDGRCGYISGLCFFYKLGLTTQVPVRYEVVSNKATHDYCNMSLGKARVVVLPPVVPVTENNYKTLQFLDMMKDVDIYSELTGKSLQKRLCRYMKKAGLNLSEIEPYFSYYPDKLYRNLREAKVI